MKTDRRDVWPLAIALLLLAATTSTTADDEVTSLKELNDRLQPGPYIDLGSDGTLTQLPEQTSALITRGKTVYAKHCASCHGVNLEGQANAEALQAAGVTPAPAHDKTGHTWHHADDQLFEYIKYGPAIALGDPSYQSMMPSFGEVLEDDDILSVLVYIRSSWPEQERRLQRLTNDDRSGR